MYKSYSKLRSNGREKVTLGKIKIHCVCTFKTMVKLLSITREKNHV